MIWIVFALSATVVAADCIAWRRLYRPIGKRGLRRTLAVLLAAVDLLPLAVFLTGTLAPDNPTPLMHLYAWMIYVYLLLSLPRLVFYLFAVLSRRRAVRVAGAAAAGTLAIVLLWGMGFCRTHLIVNRVEVCSDRLPAAFDGLRIVQFSDLHIGALLRPDAEVRRLADTIVALRPDLVVFSGDLVNIRYTELDEPMQRLLGAIDAPMGVVSTIGNHDVGVYVKDSIALPHEVNLARLIVRQQRMGWRVLDDRTIYLRRGGDSISLSGISFPASQRNLRHKSSLPGIDVGPVYAGVPDSLYNITVSHLPQLWRTIRERGYGDLTLAGHVHSMQFKVRLFGSQYSPAAWLYKEWSGPYREEGSLLYINDGIGSVGYPMRVGACPEVTLFVLRRGCENER